MTGPYSSALLNAPAPAAPRQQVAVPAYAGMPMQYAAPQQPQYVQAPRQGRRGSRIESALLGIIALVVVAIMAVAGYAMARGTAPSAREYAAAQNISQYNGYMNGRQFGVQAGRNEAIANGRRLAQLQALIARQRVFNKGYAQGQRIGLGQYNRPRYSGYSGYRGRSYRTPRYSYGGGNSSATAVSSAVQAAQQYANATGSTVDVEVQ